MNAAQRFAEIGWTVQPDGCWIWNGRTDRTGYVPGKPGGRGRPSGSQPGSLPALAQQLGVSRQTIWAALRREPMMEAAR